MRFVKDNDAVLDFAIDWSDWLDDAEGETILNYQLRPSTGITINSHSQADGVVTMWLSGGEAGRNYTVGCLITTNSLPRRIDERTITISVRQR